jgi:hypothetical protein
MNVKRRLCGFALAVALVAVVVQVENTDVFAE